VRIVKSRVRNLNEAVAELVEDIEADVPRIEMYGRRSNIGVSHQGVVNALNDLLDTVFVRREEDV
jgi:dihydroxyacetone kinase DhaKLM complex PTS-EIIA-like component DhaM